MLAYNKLIAAVVSIMATRLMLRWTGIDLAEIDDEGEIRTAIALTIDASVAAITGFVVWWVPNVHARLRDKWRKLWLRIHGIKA